MEKQDGRGVGGVEYISLHGYMRGTPSDTEMQGKHQLRVKGPPDQWKSV